jgi:hypothetical protein
MQRAMKALNGELKRSALQFRRSYWATHRSTRRDVYIRRYFFVSGANLQSATKAKTEFVAHYARNCSRLNLATPGQGWDKRKTQPKFEVRGVGSGGRDVGGATAGGQVGSRGSIQKAGFSV